MYSVTKMTIVWNVTMQVQLGKYKANEIRNCSYKILIQSSKFQSKLNSEIWTEYIFSYKSNTKLS